MEFDSLYLYSKIKYFNVENGQIKGNGLRLIKSIFKESQFVCFGEGHNSKQISLLVKAIVPYLKENDFKSAAFEVGPYSAKVLKELSTPWDKTIENLREFNTKYYVKPVDEEPIVFFSGTEDAEFLMEISKNKINIWGLDQEFYSSPNFFLDLLFRNLSINEQEKFQHLKAKAEHSLDDLYRQDSLKLNNFNFNIEFLKNENINNYFGVFTDPISVDMIKELKTSFEIYSVWDKPGGHKKRIDYMKANFLKHYELQKKTESPPKVFLKFGDVHMPKTLSLGVNDLGNLANEISKSNNTNCTNVKCLRRYFDEDGKITDYINDSAFKNLREFLKFGKRDEWVIIDIKSVKKDFEDKKINISNPELFNILNGWDYIFVLPTWRVAMAIGSLGAGSFPTAWTKGNAYDE